MSSMPKDFTPWPPPSVAKIYEDITKWSAWWAGDPDELSAVYGSWSGSAREARPAGQGVMGGIGGRLKRMFWGTPTDPQSQQPKRRAISCTKPPNS